jgi:hypothetical protein
MDPLEDFEAAFRKLSKLFVATKYHERALVRLNECTQLSRLDGEPHNMLLVGDSGSGKTFTLSHFRALQSDTQNASAYNRLQILTPSDAKPKSMNAAILEAAGDVFAWRGTYHQQMDRLPEVLDAREVNMIMIDEFQHVFEGKPKATTKSAMQWLKNIHNKLRRPIVLSGLTNICGFVQSSVELARRFSVVVRLPRLAISSPEHTREFRRVLAEIDAVMPYPSKIPFAEDQMLLRFYCASGGALGRVTDLTKRASLYTHKSGEHETSLEHLAAAFKAEFEGATGDVNPFELPNDKLRERAERIHKEECTRAEKAAKQQRSEVLPFWLAQFSS